MRDDPITRSSRPLLGNIQNADIYAAHAELDAVTSRPSSVS